MNVTGNRTTSKDVRRRRRHGVSPWIPNQHGAWAMLIIPALIGCVGALRAGVAEPESTFAFVIVPALLIAWLCGYGAFFAFGLAARARPGQRRRRYLRPVYVYGAVSAAALLVVVLLRPGWLVAWAAVYSPLLAAAVIETLRGQARSILSGVATTIAAALLIMVLTSAGAGWALVDGPWGRFDTSLVAAVFTAVYFTSSVPYVKTVIRKRGDRGYLIGSVVYHVAAVIAVVALVVLTHTPLLPAVLMIVVMMLALARAVMVPRAQARGVRWSPKRVGMAEIPLSIVAAFAAVILLW